MANMKNPDARDMSIEAYLEELRFHFHVVVSACGSRVTCNPPPEDTDADYLVLVEPDESRISKLVEHMSQNNWDWEGGMHYQQVVASDFMSWRKDQNNLIITSNVAFWKRHKLATAICTKLNLLNKPDRIALFQAVLYENIDGAIVL
jgi:hypothetical protein